MREQAPDLPIQRLGIFKVGHAHRATGAMARPIDDLAFAFVAPWGADDDDCAGHGCRSPACPEGLTRPSTGTRRADGTRMCALLSAKPRTPSKRRRSCRSRLLA